MNVKNKGKGIMTRISSLNAKYLARWMHFEYLVHSILMSSVILLYVIKE